MDDKKLREIYIRYCTIKTKASTGNKISRKEAMEALKLKKILNKHSYKGDKE